MTYEFETLERLPPPLRVVVPDPGSLELWSPRVRVRKNL